MIRNHAPSDTRFRRIRMQTEFCRPIFRIALIAVLAGGFWISADVQGPAMAETAAPTDDAFNRWVNSLWPSARRAGVSSATFRKAFKGVRPNEKVFERANNQPEFVRPVWSYLDSALSDKRIEGGKEKLAEWQKSLAQIERTYGVDRHTLVAIWGMESAYGTFKGNDYVIQALATLGYRGSRRKFGRQQVIAALKILQRGDITPERMLGSWAGAMGHTQFIPTTYNAYAVDFNRDGRRDIWNTEVDALASAANYLRKSGWRSGEPAFHEIVLPRGFDYRLATRAVKKQTAEWVALGIKRANRRKFGAWAREGSIVLPAGANGPAFMVYQNFRAIMRYNNSVSYALAIALLAERFRGRGTLVQSWPLDDSPLSRSQKKELQRLLAGKRLYRGRVDGRIGRGTQAAIRTFQGKIGVAQDGYPSASLLKRLRRGG